MQSVAISVIAVFMFGLVQSGPIEQFSCESLDSVLTRMIIDCHETSALYKMVMEMIEEKVITKEMIQNRLESTCNNPQTRIEYASCMGGLIADCPELENNITSGIDNQISFFCDIDQPAEWLQTAFKNGYKFNTECFDISNPAFELFMACVDQDAYTNALEARTFEEGLDRLQRVYTSFFYRSAIQFEEKVRTEIKPLECGSTWADFFITKWLFIKASVAVPLVATFGEQEKRVLMGMKTTEVEALWEHKFFQ